MVSFCYFSRYLKLGLSKGISIALYPPSWVRGISSYSKLFPPKQLLSLYKSGVCSEEEYIQIYTKEVLDKLNPQKVYKDLKGKVVLCYESKDNFCHRHIVKAWLQAAGFKAEEI